MTQSALLCTVLGVHLSFFMVRMDVSIDFFSVTRQKTFILLGYCQDPLVPQLSDNTQELLFALEMTHQMQLFCAVFFLLLLLL